MADLVVEDGTGLANADAYASRAAVLAYWLNRADSAFADAASDALRDAAIRRATQFIDVPWGDRFKGEREFEGQGLQWPRLGVYTPEGWDVDGVPPQIVAATAELAKLALAAPLAGSGATAPSPSQSAISSIKAGSVEISYAAQMKAAIEADHVDKFYLINAILKPLTGGGALNRGLAR